MTGDLLLLRGQEIGELFAGKELELIEIVRAAYILHHRGESLVPNCPFLSFPHNSAARIIAKPAYLGGSVPVAGIKWVASFPENLKHGQDRASAVMVLNSVQTGFATAILEGSLISAWRTAASAALAAHTFLAEVPPETIGLIGCGLINFHTLRFLLALWPQVRRVLTFDLDPQRSASFVSQSQSLTRELIWQTVPTAQHLLAQADVTSLATTATIPHLATWVASGPDAVVLHISLRDFTPSAVLQADNVVDDVEHVCSNKTSVHLTSEAEENRRFLRTTLGAILDGEAHARVPGKPVLFSPFGLGILDLALAQAALDLAKQRDRGTVIENFLPPSWIGDTA